MTEFSSPINLGLSAGPVGVDDEAVREEFQKLYNAIRLLQQKFGTYNGLEVLDPVRYITQLAPSLDDSIQIQRMNTALLVCNVVSALTAGQLIFITAAGEIKKADASAGVQKGAWGWVPNAIAAGDSGIVYFSDGLNIGFGGLTIGSTYYLSATTPGGITVTAPVASGTIRQEVGVALTANKLLMRLGDISINP